MIRILGLKILASIIFLSLPTLAFANETMDALANAAARFSAAIEQQLAIVQNEPVTADFAATGALFGQSRRLRKGRRNSNVLKRSRRPSTRILMGSISRAAELMGD